MANLTVSGVINTQNASWGTNANGEYTLSGTINGRDSWVRTSGGFTYTVQWDSNLWIIRWTSPAGITLADGVIEDVQYPWLTTYTPRTVYNFSGTIVMSEVTTEPPASTFGLPADVVALITSRFGTVANFLRLRNQGQV